MTERITKAFLGTDNSDDSLVRGHASPGATASVQVDVLQPLYANY